MLKKLSQFILSLFYKFNSKLPSDVLFLDQNGNYVTKSSFRSSKTIDELLKMEQQEETDEVLTYDVAEKIDNKEVVTMNIDTGKIIFPDSMSEKDKKEVEEALRELNDSLQKLAPDDLFASLEDFINKGGTIEKDPWNELESFPIWDGLTPVNDDENALAKVKEEMDFCEEQTEHWNDHDFAEALNQFESQGYEFTGVEDIYRKINQQLELSQDEQKKLREWYKLATQEMVYEV